ENEGARKQRLLFASTSTKDPALSDTMYVTALAAPDTINTMPEETVLAFADHGELTGPLSAAPEPVDALAASFAEAGFDLDQIGLELQQEGAQKFVDSWEDLLAQIESKSAKLGAAG
ncbi:MAG: transaldolase, partial [Thermoleophilia bacterium]|nr:transaldolase [Thermoleophilia bacterium]